MAQRKYKNPITFDTLSYAKKLQAVGFTPEQAEVQAETFLSIVEDQLVSKRDLKDLEAKMQRNHEKTQADIENVRKELTIEIESIRKELQVEVENIRKDIKVEVENIRKDIKVEVENIRKEMKVGTELLRRDLKIWFGGMLVVTVSVLSAMMTLVVHLSR